MSHSLTPIRTLGSCDGEACKGSRTSRGYRYRLPIPAELKIKVAAENNVATVESRFVVAQYGAVAALPSTFGGVGGRVVIDTYEDSGSIKSVTIGQTPAPTESVTEVTQAFGEIVEARRKARAEEAAREATAEKDALSEERDILQLRKEIRELKEALGEE